MNRATQQFQGSNTILEKLAALLAEFWSEYLKKSDAVCQTDKIPTKMIKNNNDKLQQNEIKNAKVDYSLDLASLD